MTPSEGAVRVAELEVAKAEVVAAAAVERLRRHTQAADAVPAGIIADVKAACTLALLDLDIARVRLEVLRRPSQVESPATATNTGESLG